MSGRRSFCLPRWHARIYVVGKARLFLAFFFPGRGTAVLNVTHIDAPLDPVAAGRCVDGDAAALSSVRVMGPCSAMGAAAAHALDLAASGASVHEIDIAQLTGRLAANRGGTS